MDQARSHEHFLPEGGGLVPSPDRLRKVLVVGAGVAGLQTARQMLRLGAQVLVLEANDDIGGVWCRNYHGFGLQVPWRMYQFPEFPWPKDLQPSSEYPTGEEVQEYVRAYCAEYDLKRYVRFNCKLLRLRWCPIGRHWDALYCDTNQEKFFKVTVDYAVICAGIYSQPYIPDYEGTDSYAGIQLHAKDFVDLSLARGRRVVIVGAGKTALDCVSSIVATNTATSVTLLYRQAHWPVPRRMLGTSIRRLLFNRAMSGMMPPYYTAGSAAHVASKAMAPLKKLFWRGMEAIIGRKFRITEQMRPRVHLPDDLFYGGQILDNTMDKLIRSEALVTIKGEINRFVRNGVILQDGNFVAADLVLYCTGYLKTYDYLDGDMRSRLDLQKDGLYLYRNCLPYAVPHLAFIGSEVSTYNNILTHGLQALWLAQVLSGRLQLPAPSAMAEDIRSQQRWRRGIMPAQRSRGSVLMMYMMQYHDQLMADIGQPSRRKGLNILAECFGTYTAFDYRTLLVEDKTAIAHAREGAQGIQLAGAEALSAARAASGCSGPSSAAGAAAVTAASGGAHTSPSGVGGGLDGGNGAAANAGSTRYGRLQGQMFDNRLGNGSHGGTSVNARSVLRSNDDLYGGGGAGGLPYHPVHMPSGVSAAGCPGSSPTSIAEGSSYRVSDTDVETAADPAQIASMVTTSPDLHQRLYGPPSFNTCGAPMSAVYEGHRQVARASGTRMSADIAAMPPYCRTRRAARAAGGGGASANGPFGVASASVPAAATTTTFSKQGGPALCAGGAPHSGRVRRGGAANDTAPTAPFGAPSRQMPPPLPPYSQSVQGRSNAQGGQPPTAEAAAAARAALMARASDFLADSGVPGSGLQVGCRSFTTTRGSPRDAVTRGIMNTTAGVLAPPSPSRLSRYTGPESPLPQRSRRAPPPPPPQQLPHTHAHCSLRSEDDIMIPHDGNNAGSDCGRQAARRASTKSASNSHSAPNPQEASHRTFSSNAVRAGGVRSSGNTGCCMQCCPCCTAGRDAGAVAIPLAEGKAPAAGRSAFTCCCQPRPLINPPNNLVSVSETDSGSGSGSGSAPFEDPEDGELPYGGCDAVLLAQDCSSGREDAGAADIEGICEADYEGQGQGDRGGNGIVVFGPVAVAAASGAGSRATAGSASASCVDSPCSQRVVQTNALHSDTAAAATATMSNGAVVTMPAVAAPGVPVVRLSQQVRAQGSHKDVHSAACGDVASSSDRSHRLSRSSGESNASSAVYSGHIADGVNTDSVCGGAGSSGGGCMSLASPPMRSQQKKDQQQAPCPSVDSAVMAAAAPVAAPAAAVAATATVIGQRASDEPLPHIPPVQERDRDSPPPQPLPPPQPPRPAPLLPAPPQTLPVLTPSAAWPPPPRLAAAAAAGESSWRVSALQHVQTTSPFGSVPLEQGTVGSPGSAASLSHWTSGALVAGRPAAVRWPSVEGMWPPPLFGLPETEEGEDAGGDGIVVGDLTAGDDRS